MLFDFVTICDYHMVMKRISGEKQVGVAELKARLSEHLRTVRGGEEIVVCDRETPIARIVPWKRSRLQVQPAKRKPHPLPFPSIPAKFAKEFEGLDVVELLLEDRRKR